MIRLALLGVLLVGGLSAPVMAVTSSSTNYKVTETQFNAGSTSKSCSDQYCSQASIGDTTDGSASNASGSAVFGDLVSTDPSLDVIVEVGQSNLGVLTTETTATKTTVVRVRNYLSGGYIVQVVGDAPKFGDHTLATPNTPTRSQPGTEQFGINLAANSLPKVGALPVQVPADQPIVGFVDERYRSADLFKYTSEDVIARSQALSGRTDYTISMIVNISNATPPGHYTGDFAAIVVPVY